MDEMERAHHELDRLQGVIDRHERHMFTIRGWLLAVIGGLLAAHYTENITIDDMWLRSALFLIVLIFFLIDSRHVNLVESVVERSTAVEKLIRESQGTTGNAKKGWYDGPQLSDACLRGVQRRWPVSGMTFTLNQAFYFVVLVVVVLASFSLPPKLG